jgi:hypothetical protein
MLGGSELYLAVDHALYKYGHPQSLWASPKRILDNFVEPPMTLPGRLALMRIRNANGTTNNRIVRIRDSGLETVSNIPESASTTFGYDSKTTPEIMSVSRTDDVANFRAFVRIDDRRRLRIEDLCQAVASDREILAMLCTTKTIAGNRFRQYVAAYPWPKVPPMRRPSSFGSK